MNKAPIAVALDAPDLGVVRAWSRAVAPVVSTLKVGLEVYCRDGAAAVQAARQGASEVGFADIQIFLDLKLHDIPATVAGAALAVAELEPAFLTVHASGGAAMIEAAVNALPDTRITAVTILTSMDEATLASIGMAGPTIDAAVRLAKLAVEAGARAIVCSPLEVAAIRAAVPATITLITPGVRPAGAAVNDQKRVATPQDAMAGGADLLVIGRPITAAPDITAAAWLIAQSLQA
ncbi:MAG: orotidine-5'-phosphate decarboxylase [Actinobacteria bacterium]|uniref:Orotidine 5'-phosphate decarboxylase n=1 Tax=freshwater metagenome TaxID=449393 RepID=A0A6J7FHA8_9ZZZZ|nr:orotidine-5'-phosphate decarboxylase [Actinomycetota bacterium]MTB28662.1 orotidine-5'-phosphate decarboxylase [Actinomycetota bacterium]